MNCVGCLNDIVDNIFYRDKEFSPWLKSNYCSECLNYMIQNQLKHFVEKIKTENCKKSLERLIQMGPPNNIREPLGLPCENEKNEVYDLLINGEISSAKVINTLKEEELEEFNKIMNSLKLIFNLK